MKSPEATLFEDIFGVTISEGEVFTEDERGVIRDAIDTLTPREAEVVTLRYFQGQTFPEIAAKLPRADNRGGGMGVTRERVRQIISKSLRKLRHPSRSRILKDIVIRVKEEELPINNNS